MAKLTPLQKAVSDLGYDIHKYNYLAKEGHVKMKKLTITLVNMKFKPLKEVQALVHKGIAMHKEFRACYTFTHVNSGIAIYAGKEMTYKQARVLTVKLADLTEWEKYGKEIVDHVDDLKDVAAQFPSLYFQALEEVK